MTPLVQLGKGGRLWGLGGGGVITLSQFWRNVFDTVWKLGFLKFFARSDQMLYDPGIMRVKTMFFLLYVKIGLTSSIVPSGL
jgi:hypothetical protein